MQRIKWGAAESSFSFLFTQLLLECCRQSFCLLFVGACALHGCVSFLLGVLSVPSGAISLEQQMNQFILGKAQGSDNIQGERVAVLLKEVGTLVFDVA